VVSPDNSALHGFHAGLQRKRLLDAIARRWGRYVVSIEPIELVLVLHGTLGHSIRLVASPRLQLHPFPAYDSAGGGKACCRSAVCEDWRGHHCAGGRPLGAHWRRPLCWPAAHLCMLSHPQATPIKNGRPAGIVISLPYLRIRVAQRAPYKPHQVCARQRPPHRRVAAVRSCGSDAALHSASFVCPSTAPAC
jgi:hypothetical protein